MKIFNRIIDYSFIEKFDIGNLEKALVLPIKSDGIYFKCCICEESNLELLKLDNLVKSTYLKKEEILFYLSDIKNRVRLYNLSEKIIKNLNLNENLVEKFFQILIEKALYLKSSDVHIESCEKSLVIRFRIDGSLKIFFIYKKEFLNSLSSYIKTISKLDVTQNRIPMDGRFTFFVEDKKYDFRVSTMPTIFGESIVIRVLDNSYVKKDLEELGFSNRIYKKFNEIVNLTQGLVLITGPTGSGKSTTLYAIIEKLNNEDKKIITIEDPVEYKIEQIQQIEINEDIKLDFDRVLKNILRQDPDIILIGEIRDDKSLSIALQAALTGHLVFASIHSNNSVETISRLIDLKADKYLISTTLKYIISQRLVLSICTNCKNSGCKYCHYSGFLGRSSVVEVLKVDEIISSLLLKLEDYKKIKEYLKEIKFYTMLDDGKEKVKNGVTTLEQVYKVINI